MQNKHNQKPNFNKNRPKEAIKSQEQRPRTTDVARSASRGEAMRASKRALDDAERLTSLQMNSKMGPTGSQPRANFIPVNDFAGKLKITFLGGQEAIGEKNMQVLEYGNDAIILDCGMYLGVDLPGVNYVIAETTYLETIRHKIKAYVISHGHLDHLGAMRHIVPKFPAPIFGSLFTLDVIKKTFEEISQDAAEGFNPEFVPMNMDNHDRVKVGEFFIELVRITHSVPESSVIVVDTPVGRVMNTGDWRLDPEPLDDMPTDVKRLKELGDEGVLLLMSDSCNTPLPGRTPTEHTLQDSFHDIIGNASGRMFVSIFSSNMNRIQMIVNSAVASGRKVALDGRSMLMYAEIAVRRGVLKVPKGTFVSMKEIASLPEDKILVVCTGGQGEPNSALQRMSEGNHNHINLKPLDTVVVSSTPIPGNEVRYEAIGNNLAKLGVHLFRHPTHEIDGVGPLHVSGHARRDEYREMLHIVRPKLFLPIYAGFLNRKYYMNMAIEEGWARQNVIMAENGDSIVFDQDGWKKAGEVPAGSMLVDQAGSIVNTVVIKDRILLSEQGLVAVVLTIDRRTGQLMTSPDIISRGFIYMREHEELMNLFRIELKRAVTQRFKRVDIDRFKQELKEYITHFLYEQTQSTPIVIPVINVVGGRSQDPGQNNAPRPQSQPADQTNNDQQSPDHEAQQQKRFSELRQQLLGADQK
jgi:ribonuclease J